MNFMLGVFFCTIRTHFLLHIFMVLCFYVCECCKFYFVDCFDFGLRKNDCFLILPPIPLVTFKFFLKNSFLYSFFVLKFNLLFVLKLNLFFNLIFLLITKKIRCNNVYYFSYNYLWFCVCK